MLRNACLLATLVLISSPTLAQESAEGTWKLKKAKKDETKAEYYILSRTEDGKINGQRVPAYSFLNTEITAELKDDKLSGQIFYMDKKDGSPWSKKDKCPAAKWEFVLKADSMTGRWEQLDADFDATDEKNLVLERIWKDRGMTRLPRLGGLGTFLPEVPAPAGPDLSGFSAQVFVGEYLLADNTRVTIRLLEGVLTLNVAGQAYTLKTGTAVLAGELNGSASPCSIELGLVDNGLSGRLAWKDYDVETKKTIHQGWSPIVLEKLLRSGPKPVAEQPGDVSSENLTEEVLNGEWMFRGQKTLGTANASGFALALRGVNLSSLKIDTGILKGTESNDGFVLAWELGLKDSTLVGRRQWIKHRKGSTEAIETGWVPVELTKVQAEPKPEVEAEPKVEPAPIPMVEPAPIPAVEPKPEVEAVLFGVKVGAESVSPDTLAVAEGDKGSLAGSWKLGTKRYLRLTQSEEGAVLGKLHWDEGVYDVALKIEGDVAKGTVTWQSDDEKLELGIEIALPVGGKSSARTEWTLWKSDSKEKTESGWVGHVLAKLKRIG
jgi:hypothetical protein